MFLFGVSVFDSLVSGLLQRGDQLFIQSVFRAVCITDAALAGDGLKPDAGVKVLAADVTVVIIVAGIIIDITAGAEVVISTLTYNLPCIAAVDKLKVVVFANGLRVLLENVIDASIERLHRNV